MQMRKNGAYTGIFAKSKNLFFANVSLIPAEIPKIVPYWSSLGYKGPGGYNLDRFVCDYID